VTDFPFLSVTSPTGAFFHVDAMEPAPFPDSPFRLSKDPCHFGSTVVVLDGSLPNQGVQDVFDAVESFLELLAIHGGRPHSFTGQVSSSERYGMPNSCANPS